MTGRARKMLMAMFLLDGILITCGIWYWERAGRPGVPAGRADIGIEVRRVEPALTEIDLVNKGNAEGLIRGDVDVTWARADLVQAQALPGFEYSDTGRRSARFHPMDAAMRLGPAQKRAIGWVKLTDDSPVRAEMAQEPQ